MLNTLMNAAHKSIVLGLVGLTAAGSYTIGSGLLELRAKRLANTTPPPASMPEAKVPEKVAN